MHSMKSYSRVLKKCSSIKCFSTTPVSQIRRQKAHPKLPVPSKEKPKVNVPEDHALWAFFRSNRQTLSTPKDDAKHGRSWTAEELRKKSFDDLHSLWVVCLKERNIISTQRHERRRQRIVEAGNKEATERDRTVKRTMAGIKFVLNERFLAYQQAVELAKEDGTMSAKATPQNHRSIDTNQQNKKLVAHSQAAIGEAPSKGLTGTKRKADALFKLKAAELARAKNLPVTV